MSKIRTRTGDKGGVEPKPAALRPAFAPMYRLKAMLSNAAAAQPDNPEQQAPDPPPPGCTPPATPNVQVTFNLHAQDEPSIAVNPQAAENVLVACNDFRLGTNRTGIYRSVDIGSSFSFQGLLAMPAELPALLFASDPIVAAGFDNTFLVVNLAFSGNGDGTVLAHRSADNGASFAPPIVVARGFDGIVDNDKPTVAIDTAGSSPFAGRRAYASYTRFFDNDQGTAIFSQRSEATQPQDLGKSWLEPILLSDPTTCVQGSSIAVGPVGQVYCGWIEFAPGQRFLVSRSLDGGASFEPPIPVADISPIIDPLPVPGWRFRVLTLANLAADTSPSPFFGRVYAVWDDNRSGTSDVLLSRSDDQGLTWSAPVSVTGSPSSQNFFSTVHVSPFTGQVQVVYYTNRCSPAPGNRLDVFVAVSNDGADSFVNRRVTDRSFNPGRATFIGDYIGGAVLPPTTTSQVIAAWTDLRTRNQDIFSGK